MKKTREPVRTFLSILLTMTFVLGYTAPALAENEDSEFYGSADDAAVYCDETGAPGGMDDAFFTEDGEAGSGVIYDGSGTIDDGLYGSAGTDPEDYGEPYSEGGNDVPGDSDDMTWGETGSGGVYYGDDAYDGAVYGDGDTDGISEDIPAAESGSADAYTDWDFYEEDGYTDTGADTSAADFSDEDAGFAGGSALSDADAASREDFGSAYQEGPGSAAAFSENAGTPAEDAALSGSESVPTEDEVFHAVLEGTASDTWSDRSGGDEDTEELFAGYVDSVLYEDVEESGDVFRTKYAGDADDTASEYGSGAGYTDPDYPDADYGADAVYFAAASADGGEVREVRAAASVRLDSLEERIVDILIPEIFEVAAGRRASTEFEIAVSKLGLDKLTFSAEELGIEAVVKNRKIAAEVKDALWKNALPFSLRKVHLSLMQQYPYEMYWYDKTLGVSKFIDFRAVYDSELGEYVLSFEDCTLRLMMSVASEYAVSRYVINTEIGDAVETAKTTAEAIVGKYADVSDYDKLHGYLEEICTRVSYNYAAINQNAAYGNPWQLIWVFDGDTGTDVVCEGYAKAFLYLCDLTKFDLGSIDCTIVTGTAVRKSKSEGHMWNVVRMGDGLNYLVDVTFCDQESEERGYTENYFLTGTPDTLTADDGTITGYYFKKYGVGYEYDSYMLEMFNWADIELSSASYLDLGRVTVVTAEDQDYTGMPLTPAVTVEHKGTILAEDTDYTLSYSANTDAGTAKITVTGCGAYAGSAEGAFEIRPRSVADAVIGTIGQKTYNGNEIKPSPSVKVAGTELIKGADYSITYKNNKNPGTATLTITGKGNYTGSASAAFTIARASVAKASVSGIVSKTYNGQPQTQKPVVVMNGRTLKENTDYTLSYKNRTHAGTASVTITGTGNYQGKLTKNFTIKPRSIAKASVTGVKAKVYNGKALTQTPVVKLDGKTLTKGTHYQLTYTANKNVGIATMTVTGKGDYSGSVKRTFTILPKGTTVASVTPGSRSLTVKWAKQAAQTTGYQIQYSTNKNFTSGSVLKNIGNPKTVSLAVKGLKSKKTYYVRVRTYKIVGKKTYYSSWSGNKSVKTK